MTAEQAKIEEAIQLVTNLMREMPFTVEFKATDNPRGIRIIYELTQEEMDYFAQM